MSEPAKYRHSLEPHQPVDLDDFERRLREQPVGGEPSSDPLAELARIVGGDADPFRKIFSEQNSRAHLRPVEPVAVDPYAPAYDPQFDAMIASRLSGEADGYGQQQAYGHQQPAYHDQQGHYAPQVQHGGYAHDGYEQQQAYSMYGDTSRSDPNAPWLDPVMMAPPEHDLSQNEPPRRSRRAMMLMSAALVVVAGGIGGTYALRSRASGNGDMPTIMAANGPVKVQPAQTAADAPKLAVSILERGSSNINDSKVVESEEQPVDLSQAARTARAGAAPTRPARSENGAPVTLAPPAPAAAVNSIFAEPKRVKSIAVRPDGTVVQTASAPTPASRPNDMASLSGTVPSQTPSSVRPVAVASTPAPKTATRVASIATPGLADAGAILNVPPPPQTIPPTVRAAVPASAPAAPARQVASVNASAAPLTTASTSGGAFAVQLAGTTSEEEAKDAASRLGKKFSSELGSMKPTVRKFDVGSKSVFRVRVTGLSSDDANSLCARLKASGGSCFVARN